MEKIKLFEEYYDENGNTHEEWEDTDNIPGKVVYLNPELESILPELESIKSQLRELNDRLEYVAPLDEDIENAIDAIDRVFKKWEDRPISKMAKKYNL